MSDVILDVVDNAFVLSGDIAAIRANKRAASNFKAIDACFEEEGKIVLAFGGKGEVEIDALYLEMEELFDKFCIEHKKTETAANFLSGRTQRKADFSEFSAKAKDIRNNRHAAGDFDDFATVLKSNMARELYPPQLLSAYHLAFSQNACNFSVPGAGKTSIVYGAYAYLKSLPDGSRKRVNRMLIICPLAAFAPWQLEYEECFGGSPVIKKLVGVSARDRADHFIGEDDVEITLVSYQSATHGVQYIQNYLTKHNDVMVVLDEAHKIKNTDEGAKWATAILSLANAAKSRVVLTGTPAPNSREDLWNLYKFIWPDNDIIQFPLHYLAELSRSGEKEKFIEQISPFFIRIKKKDLDLPEPMHHTPKIVPMDNQQRAIYNHIEQKYIEALDGEGFVAQLKKAKLIRLRQCLTNPALLKRPLDEHADGNAPSGIDDRKIMQAIAGYESVPQKFVAAGDLAERIAQQPGAAGKMIIWACFIGNIKSLESYLAKRDIACKTLYGETPNENDETVEHAETREGIIRNFHDADCPYKVIIANPFAVGESISLHKACHNALYLEKDFNAANYMQSKDRIHRVGLNEGEVVHYYYLLSENSIDEVIHRRVLEKEETMLDIIERDEIPLLRMNMDVDDADDDDIRAILNWYHDRESA